jgi:hypothetical protein
MPWIPTEHSDDENLHWSLLRAMEWGRWPVFLSQTFAPPLLIFLSWKIVIGGTFLANILWAFFRSKFISVSLAYFGVNFALLRWLTWPIASIYLFVEGRTPECWISAFWPGLIFILGVIPPFNVGPIQTKFMEALGYTQQG